MVHGGVLDDWDGNGYSPKARRISRGGASGGRLAGTSSMMSFRLTIRWKLLFSRPIFNPAQESSTNTHARSPSQKR